MDFNYPVVIRYTKRRLLYPYFAFQLLYLLFLHQINPQMTEFAQSMYFPFLGLLVGFATYFMLNEARQLANEGPTYLLSFWNYIDLIPPIGIYVMAMMLFLSRFNILMEKHLEASLYAIISFFMWFKFLYFLRIFERTGYLIRMIVEVVSDMRYFFVVLLITIAGFSEAFQRISLANSECTADNGEEC